MNFIEVEKKATSNTEQIEFCIKIMCLLNDIKLSKYEIRTLAFYVVYGVKEKTDKLLLSSKIAKNISSLRTLKSKLTRLGFLKRDSGIYKTYELNLNKNFIPGNEIKILVKLNRVE